VKQVTAMVCLAGAGIWIRRRLSGLNEEYEDRLSPRNPAPSGVLMRLERYVAVDFQRGKSSLRYSTRLSCKRVQRHLAT